MSHTPGPWESEHSRRSWGGPLPPQIKAGANVIAVVEGSEVIYTPDGNDRDPNAEEARDNANAQLIAAAPCLLAACEEALAWADGDGLKDRLRAAIDKARTS